MSSWIWVISAGMEMNVRRSVSGDRMPSSCVTCVGSMHACCVGITCSTGWFARRIHTGLGVQRLTSRLSASMNHSWSWIWPWSWSWHWPWSWSWLYTWFVIWSRSSHSAWNVSAGCTMMEIGMSSAAGLEFGFARCHLG